jgi:hypothetical protein
MNEGLSDRHVRALAIAPTGDPIIYAATHRGIFRRLLPPAGRRTDGRKT